MVLFFEQTDSRGPLFNPRWGEQLQFDYVVIGAGSAGCAIAARFVTFRNLLNILHWEAGSSPVQRVSNRNIMAGLNSFLPAGKY